MHNPSFVQRIFFLLLAVGFASCLGNTAQASHNLAGQITYEWVGTNTYEITLTTYTDPFAAGVDRCFADIEVWGVSGEDRIFITTLSDIPRSNGPTNAECDAPARFGIFVRPGIKKNFYTTTFTFNGPGVFELRYYDVARINNVTNMSNSGATAFYVETILNNNPFNGINNSPLLLNDPLDDACLFKPWTHNPGAYDPDGDSLSYSLIPNRQYEPPNFPAPVPVANYQFPDQYGGSFTIDPETGLILWDACQQVGIYNIAILIEEWRDGVKIGEVVRDMAIFVEPCENDPPDILAITDTCVKPGDFLTFDVGVTDPDEEDSVYFYLNNGGQGNNGPFAVLTDPAEFTSNFGDPVVDIPAPLEFWEGEFSWNVTCSHLREAFYQVDFYAHDDIIHDLSAPFALTLADHHSVKIRVRPDAVDSVFATPGSKQIQLEWTPNPCPTALGYEVYRSFGPTDLETDTTCCELDNLQANYEQIAYVEGWENTSYLDDNNGEGLRYANQYCYRIVTVFEGGLRSCPSPDTCIRIDRDFVLMTNDSVSFTDPAQGSIFVSWSTPDSIDTVFFPPPYTYELYRRPQGGAFQAIATNIDFTDTTFTDTDLNTQNESYEYQVAVFDADGDEVEPARSNIPSSIFLSTAPAHQAVNLSWSETVPWINDYYEVYMSVGPGGPYARVDSVPGTGAGTHATTIGGLENGTEYCFFIRSFGSYNDSTVKTPIINDSQIACEVPRDTVAPCLPGEDTLARSLSADCENLLVEFNLTVSEDTCAADFDRYAIYYSRDSLGTYELFHQFNGPTDTNFVYDGSAFGSIAGCYRFTALDSLDNESDFSRPFCIDNCPIILLTNVFTPNGDGINDFLTPKEVRSVAYIDVAIFDRWGTAMQAKTRFERPTVSTRLWDGSSANGEDANEGVYFYVIEYKLDQLNAATFRRTGSVTLLR